MSEVHTSERNQGYKATSPSFHSKRSSAAPGSIKVSSQSIASPVSIRERRKSTVKESDKQLFKESVRSLDKEIPPEEMSKPSTVEIFRQQTFFKNDSTQSANGTVKESTGTAVKLSEGSSMRDTKVGAVVKLSDSSRKT